MGKAKINDLYEQAHVVHEIPYESSVVDPSIVSVHKQRVFDRYLFAELIAKECMIIAQEYDGAKLGGPGMIIAMRIEQHFGVE